MSCPLLLTMALRDRDNNVQTSVLAWKHRFCAECLSVVQEQVFGARVPSYALLQQLDKLVRNFYIPPSLRMRTGNAQRDSEHPSSKLVLQRHTLSLLRECGEHTCALLLFGCAGSDEVDQSYFICTGDISLERWTAARKTQCRVNMRHLSVLRSTAPVPALQQQEVCIRPSRSLPSACGLCSRMYFPQP